MPSGPGKLLLDVAERGDVGSVATAVTEALRAWVGVGPVFLATADPITGSFTDTFTFDIPAEAAAAFFDIERAGRDVLSFKDLARSRTPLGSLYAVTADSPEVSERWREVLAPLGWGDELRAAVGMHGTTWGYLCVHREAHGRPFRAQEVAQLSALLPVVAAALRRASSSPEEGTRLGTGVVMVDRRGRVVGATGAAEAWLDELGPRPPDGLPLLLAGLAATVLHSGQPATSTITTRAGRSGLAEAAQLRHAGEPEVAVVMSPAPAGHRLERLAAAVGLTPRERQIVSCVLSGKSTQEVADELVVSPHTVQAHLTSIFAKSGLRSRRELVSRLSS